ncbi:DUF983 domain-containing protein [Azospirillum sp. HJ39]|uniref:DUF983 domain-containing protein n=1 Tax=Azospirillum sp. HJ39 TaxID=3159496 RepID=UPI003557B2D8
MSSEQEWPPLPPLSTGLCGRSPRCGQGHLICFACIPTVVLAFWIEARFEPPYRVHLVTTLPFLLLACIPPLRPLKDWLVASGYVYKVEEACFGAAAPTQPPMAPHEEKDLHLT